jgi:glycosyltransferase involved in cell wall biosynthesis
MEALTWVGLGLGALWTLVFAANLREFLRTPRVRPGPPPAGVRLPSLSVIVPARDEERNLERCLRSLVAQRHVELEVLVADDRSRDRTPDIVRALMAEDPRVRLLMVDELPPGWMGKCHALEFAVRTGQPRGEWLLFTDADTWHHPEGVAAALLEAEAAGVDMLSLVPTLEAPGFWERLVQPAVAALIALFHRPSRINRTDSPEAFANGQYILVRRASYAAAGGHRAVAGKVLEDVELAHALKRSGARIRLARGPEVFATRMYVGLGALVRGWKKNLYLLVRARPSRALGAALLALTLSAGPAVLGLLAAGLLAAGVFPGPAWGAWALMGVYLTTLGFQAALRGLNGWYPVFAPLAPLGNLILVAILLASAWHHLRGRGVVWKGRRVRDGEAREE